MSDKIASILTNLLKTAGAADAAKNALNELNNFKITADMDPKAIDNILKLRKAVKSLSEAEEEYNKIKKDKEGLDLSTAKGQQELQKLNSQQLTLMKKMQQAQRVSTDYVRQYNNATKEKIRQYEEDRQAIIKNYKENTIQGKVLTALTGNVAKFAAGITAGSMALKLYNRIQDSARVRNELMIAGFRDLDDGILSAVGSVGAYESAVRSAEATAISLGMANENVTDIMVQYQRIVGTDSPKALGALAEATLAMAKVMNISGAEAMTYVQSRMDNFGGSAASALQHLDDLRESVVGYNKALAGTRLRGDDVLKVIQDITNSNTVYAADQRFLSQIMMRTSTTLQAQGESYNYAQRAAEKYTKALSSEAPEWMQITNAFDITKEVRANVDEAGNLLPEFAKKLDAAKPGLSKKVKELLDAGYSEYDVTRLLGDTLKDTEIGMTSMSKKIVELGNGAGGISRLAAVYGKTHLEALELYKAAVKTQEIEETRRVLADQTSQESITMADVQYSKMKEVLGLKDEEIAKARIDEKYREGLIRMYAEEKATGESRLAIKEREAKASLELANNTKEIEKAQKELDAAKESGSETSIKYYEGELKRLNDQRSDLIKQATGDAVGNETILGALTNKVKDFQRATGLLTGDWFKAKFTEFSSPVVLGLGALTALGWKGFDLQGKMERWLEEIATNTSNMGGGYGGGYGGPEGGGGAPRKRRKTGAEKMAQRARILGKKGAGRFGRRGLGAVGSLLGKGKDLYGTLSKNPLMRKMGGFAGVAGTLMSGFNFVTNVGQAHKERGWRGVAQEGLRTGLGAAGAIAGGLSPIPGGAMLGGMAGSWIGDKLADWDIARQKESKLTELSNEAVQRQKQILEQQAIPTMLQQPSQSTTSRGTSNSSGGPVGATFDGVNGDGSGTITLEVKNLMNLFSQANMMAKRAPAG